MMHARFLCTIWFLLAFKIYNVSKLFYDCNNYSGLCLDDFLPWSLFSWLWSVIIKLFEIVRIIAIQAAIIIIIISLVYVLIIMMTRGIDGWLVWPPQKRTFPLSLLKSPFSSKVFTSAANCGYLSGEHAANKYFLRHARTMKKYLSYFGYVRG